MPSKPTIEQFIQDCFLERTVSLKQRLEVHYAYWRRFYQSNCLTDSRRGVVEESESEKIVSVSRSNAGTEVMTTGSPRNQRSRYHVKSSGETWLIQEVDTECLRCGISGASNECAECGGTGWRSWKNQASFTRPKSGEQGADRATSSTPEVEPEGQPLRHPAIEQFMTDHFRERTATRKKELGIEAEYAKHFYSPDFDWTKWVPSVQSSEAERIANIMPTVTRAHVVTDGLGIGQLRYHLRSEGQSWLIWEVDMECPFCYLNGRRTDCIWCGGTIWEHKEAGGGYPRSGSLET